MKVIDRLSCAGNRINEDAIWCSEHCALVLDGATMLKDSVYPASVFVKEFIDVFSQQIADSSSLWEAVNGTVSVLRERRSTGDDFDPTRIPSSASGIFVYETDDEIQVLTIGDCTAILSGRLGIKKVYSGEVEAYDQKVIRRMIELHKTTGADIADLVLSDEIRDMLVENRKMMNRPGGYRILALNLGPVNEKDILSVKKDEVDQIVLYSDGFHQMEKDIIGGETDCSLLYKKLRETENADFCLNAYPRFKKSDDASILVLKISHKNSPNAASCFE